MSRPSSTSKRIWEGCCWRLPQRSNFLAACGAGLSYEPGLAQSHRQRGFSDPTNKAQVHDALRGMQAFLLQPIKQPLTPQVAGARKSTGELLEGADAATVYPRDQVLIWISDAPFGPMSCDA